MKNSTQNIDQPMKRFEEVCRNAGVKLTHQRREIFRELAQTGDHPDAENIFKRVRKRLPTVSLDTVYRTLWKLIDLGLITTLGPSRERTRFDANLSCHHHFVCVKCGATSDFYSDALENLQLPESVTHLGHVETTQVEVRGICTVCAAKENQQPIHST